MVVMATAVMVVTLYDDVGMGREPPPCRPRVFGRKTRTSSPTKAHF